VRQFHAAAVRQRLQDGPGRAARRIGKRVTGGEERAAANGRRSFRIMSVADITSILAGTPADRLGVINAARLMV
jgi:hypothetical protein